jgi:acetyl-CoA synthetase
MSIEQQPQGNERSNLPTGTFFWPLRRYLDMHRTSIEDPEGFWAEQASLLDWEKPWDKVLDWKPPYARWFCGGKLNASVQCVDRHAKSWRKNKVAIYWEGEAGDTRTLSYSDLYRRSTAVPGLCAAGGASGRPVTIYCP